MAGIPLAMGHELKNEEPHSEKEISLQSIEKEFEKINNAKKGKQEKKKWLFKR